MAFEEHLATIQQEYRQKLVPFDDYFYQLVYHITFGKDIEVNDDEDLTTIDLKEDEDNEYADFYANSSNRLEIPLHKLQEFIFLARIDTTSMQILPKISFTDEQMLTLKAQVLCYKSYLELQPPNNRLLDFVKQESSSVAIVDQSI